MTWEIRQGDALDLLRDMSPETVQTVVTSPPYWGLRDYGSEGQLGLEPTPDLYVQNLVEVFREVRRVLREDGCVFLNLGDSYAGSWGAQSREQVNSHESRPVSTTKADKILKDAAERERGISAGQIAAHPKGTRTGSIPPGSGLKPKDLCGIPWRVAFALQADGWWLRSDIIWSKPNPMPESVTDRPTRSHEYLFLLTKSARYFFDQEAVREPHTREWSEYENGSLLNGRYDESKPEGGNRMGRGASLPNPAGRNIRSVWNIATQPFPGSHFAVFPTALVEPCILAGSSPKACGKCGAPWERVVEREVTDLPRGERSWSQGSALGQPQRDAIGPLGNGLNVQPTLTTGWRPTCTHALYNCRFNNAQYAEPCDRCDGTCAVQLPGQSLVLDPFAGSGTVGVVALRHNRSFIGLELNPDYCEMARNRIRDDAPLLNYGLEAA